MAGSTTAGLALAAFAAINLTGSAPDSTIAADGPTAASGTSPSSPTTSVPSSDPAGDGSGPTAATTVTTTATTAPATESTVATTPGVDISLTTTSEWDSGYCVQVRVDNPGPDPVTWRVELDLGGALESVWAATREPSDGGTLVFTGEPGYNDTLEPGSWTTFGMCLARSGG
jgi:cellulase/cellobiase CelA1